MPCHPERSEAESKDPAALAIGIATGFLDFARNDSERLIINPIHLPSSLSFMNANQITAFQVHIPFGARPRFFVPPISVNQIRPALLYDFSRNFRTANVCEGIFIQQAGC